MSLLKPHPSLIRDKDFDLTIESEFRDAVRLRYDWEVPDTPSVCVCGDIFSVDHADDLQTGRTSHPTP